MGAKIGTVNAQPLADVRFVSPVERLLFLRSTGFLDALSDDDLVRYAQQTRECFFSKGSMMLSEGEPVDTYYILAEGRVGLYRGNKRYKLLEAPGIAGFLAMVARTPQGIGLRAETDVIGLELGYSEFLNFLEDNFGLLEKILRGTALMLSDLQIEHDKSGKMVREEPRITPYPEAALDFVQRLHYLNQIGPYQAVSLDPLADLAQRSQEVRFEPGDLLWKEGEASDYGFHILHGVIDCRGEADSRSFRMGADSVLGHLEAMAARPRTYTATAETRVVAMRGETAAFIDILEDNFGLGLSFAGFLCKNLLDMYEQVGEDY